MNIILGLLGSLALLRGMLSLLDSLHQRANFRRALNEKPPPYRPKVSVIVPCKGRDPGFEANVRSIIDQQYPDFEIIFVTDSQEDEAFQLLQRIRASVPHGYLAVATAGFASGRSQKIHNILHALTLVRSDSQVLVFADSDIRAQEHWLKNLVAPLQDSTIGATTGYRWYIPVQGSFWSAVRSHWNMTSANVLFSDTYNFVWGGSMAIRRSTFDTLQVARRWQKSLSDDMTMTQVVKLAGHKIKFVPQSLVITEEQTNLKTLLEWTSRQLKIVRIYDSKLWSFAAYPHWLFSGIFTAGLLLVLFAVTTPASIPWPVYLMLSDLVLGAVVNSVRHASFSLALGAFKRQAEGSWWAFACLHVISSYVMSWALLKSAVGRKIVWRGITYEMRSPEETVVFNV